VAARRKTPGRKKTKFKIGLNRLSLRVKHWLGKGGNLLSLLKKAVGRGIEKYARLPFILRVLSIYLLSLALVGAIFFWRINQFRSVNPYFVPPVNLGELEDILNGNRNNGRPGQETETVTTPEEAEPEPAGEPEPEPQVLPIAVWPARELGDVLQEFGKPVIYDTIYGQALKYSSGTAFQVKPGTEILAVMEGTVTVRQLGGPNMHFGYEVVIEHTRGLKSFYRTLEKVAVQNGAFVAAGQAIGTIKDRTPELTFLYLEMQLDGNAVDPLAYLR
jgi:murein DD-endopeptidase MepM/ murein hydrolase activator NlpD